MKRAAESLVATTASSWPVETPLAMRSEDRYQVIDALNRFAAGQDLRDPGLLSSAFAADFSWVSLERAGERWQITHMRIENVWHRGDPKVLFP